MRHEPVVRDLDERQPSPRPNGHWMNRFWGPVTRSIIELIARVPIYRYILRPEPGARAVLESGEPVLFTCVHQDVFDCCNALPRLLPERRFAAIVSYSRDGNHAATGLSILGYEVIRGSSSRGGGEGLMMLRSSLKSGYSIVMASDGPKAPLGDIKPGVVHLAASSGAPILPIRAWGLNRLCFNRSWSKAVLSVPFCPVVVRVGNPIRVPNPCPDPRRYQIGIARSIVDLARWTSRWAGANPRAPYLVKDG